MQKPGIFWRSVMFVPVIVEKFVRTAHTRGADAYILDLEDSVPAAAKAQARERLAAAAAEVGRSGADIVVRINRPWRLAVRDLEVAVIAGIDALALPKVAGPEHVRAVAEIVGELEAERGLAAGQVRLIPMVETADAFFQMREIARADARVVAMTLGAEDFALDVGMVPAAEGLMYPKQQMILAARAAGIAPLGFVGSIADYADQEAFRRTIRQARRLGFQGGFCIHPLQVAIMNEAFAPSAEEVAHAEGLLKAYDAALAKGLGAVSYEGSMVDEPVARRARDLLALHHRFQSRR